MSLVPPIIHHGKRCLVPCPIEQCNCERRSIYDVMLGEYRDIWPDPDFYINDGHTGMLRTTLDAELAQLYGEAAAAQQLMCDP